MQRLFFLFFVLLFFALCGFSQSLNNNLKKSDWVFSEKDFNLDIKERTNGQSSHQTHVARKAANETELLLIRKAEALYPKEAEVRKLQMPENNKVFSPSVEDAPFWFNDSFDGVKIARIVSTRAMDYYLKLSSAYRDNLKPTSINMSRTGFTYSAEIVHYDKYDFQRETFENVNVVFLKMSWSQYCGGDCAMGFTREKFVVFDKNHEPVALFLDLETGAWVS